MSFPFRYLTPEEQETFQEHARSTYKPFSDISGIWHPIYQAECAKINHERAIYTVDENEPGSLEHIDAVFDIDTHADD